MAQEIDALDARIITVFTQDPHIGVLGASRELGVARGTVQSRLDRLRKRGVIASLAPTISPAAAGFPVTAYCQLQIRQASATKIASHLEVIPEVVEAHTITGTFDMVLVVVAASNQDLQRVIDRIVEHEQIERAATQIVLTTHIRHRTLPLVQAVGRAAPESGDDDGGADLGAP